MSKKTEKKGDEIVVLDCGAGKCPTVRRNAEGQVEIRDDDGGAVTLSVAQFNLLCKIKFER